MKPDLEQQYQNAELGQASQNRVRGIDESEKRRSEQNAGDQLTDNGWLADPLSNCPECFCRRQEYDERKQKVRKRMVVQAKSGFIIYWSPDMDQNLHLSKSIGGL